MSEEPPLISAQGGGEERGEARALLDAAIHSPNTRESDVTGLAAVEEALARLEASGEPDQETLVILLHAKCSYLGRAGRLEEALAVCDREIDLAHDSAEESGMGKTAQLGTEAYLVRASLLGRLDRPEEALETATAVQELIESEDSDESDAKFRFFATWAAKLRLHQLVALRRFDNAAGSWTDLLQRYGHDPDAGVRAQVAWAGALAAAAAVEEKNRRLALALAEDVIGAFGSSAEPGVRPGVATAMAIKVFVLSKRGRLRTASRVGSELVSFLGPNPEPQIVEALGTIPGGHRWISNARALESR